MLTVAVASGWLGYALVLHHEIRTAERHEHKERALLKEMLAKIRKASSISAELEETLDGRRRLLVNLDDAELKRALARLTGVYAADIHSDSLENDFHIERHAMSAKRGLAVKRRTHPWSSSMWLVALLLTGCEAEAGDLEQQVRKARAARSESAESLPNPAVPAVLAPTVVRGPFGNELTATRVERWKIIRRAN